MNYNIKHIELQYAMIEIFMHRMSYEILDISYACEKNTLTIQVVLLEGFKLSDEIIDRLQVYLHEYIIYIHEFHISKEKFNESKGEWVPTGYQWLEHLLFSKAEAI